MTTQTLSARTFSLNGARVRRARFSWTTLVLMVLWLSGVLLAARGPAAAEPVLLVLFSTGLIGLSALLSRYAAPETATGKRVGADGD
jgi:hypothetical protein